MADLTKQQELMRLEAAVEICNRRDVLKNEIEDYNELIDMPLPTVREFKKMLYTAEAPRMLLVILSVVVGFALTCFVGWQINPAYASDYGAISVGVMFLMYFLVFKPLFFLFKAKEISGYRTGLKASYEEIPLLRILREERKAELAALEQEMLDENVCIVPPAYWDHASQILYLIRNKRAYDLVSAINKFEDIMHQSWMESMAQESLALSELTAINSEIAAHNSAVAAENSRIAARNSGISAMFSIAAYLNS